ncbi:MAG: hypothetical protein GY705_16420 [Bacteroidetes bacterium]|nr:hypothetical protein [Bacteroidota bacterium]
MEFLYVLAIVFAFFALSFVLINIRHVVTGKEFRGTCSTNNPFSKNKIGGCGACGGKEEGTCKNKL